MLNSINRLMRLVLLERLKVAQVREARECIMWHAHITERERERMCFGVSQFEFVAGINK